MDLDQYQLPIALTKFNFKLSGIYFRPHHRILPSRDTWESKITTEVKKIKKQISELLLLSNKKVKKIFILNDEEGAHKLNAIYNTKRFVYLPDPIFDYDYEDLSSIHGLTISEKTNLLIFGSINERKNVTKILIAYANAALVSPTHLYIVGPLTAEYLTYLTALISQYKIDEMPNKSITIYNSFVTDSQMEYIHSQSDISLMIYKDFYGSSGLIGRAAKHGLLSLVPNVGLLSNLVETYNLGLTCDAEDSNSIQNGLERAVIDVTQFDKTGCKRFHQDHSPINFMFILFSITEL